MKFKHEARAVLPRAAHINNSCQFSDDQPRLTRDHWPQPGAGAGDKNSELRLRGRGMHRGPGANAIIKLTDQINAFIIYTFLSHPFSKKCMKQKIAKH